MHLPHAERTLPREVPDVINGAIRQAMLPAEAERFTGCGPDVASSAGYRRMPSGAAADVFPFVKGAKTGTMARTGTMAQNGDFDGDR